MFGPQEIADWLRDERIAEQAERQQATAVETNRH